MSLTLSRFVDRRGRQCRRKQPTTVEELHHARTALAACPVAAIRLETLGERRHRADSPEQKKIVEQSWTEKDESLVQKMVGKNGETVAANPDYH